MSDSGLGSGSPDSQVSVSTPLLKLSVFKQNKSQPLQVHPDLLNRAAKAILDRETEAALWIDSNRTAHIEKKLLSDEWYLKAAERFETVMVLRYVHLSG